MPINKTNPLSQLAEALKYYYQKTKLRISIEYLLLNNINDSIKDAQLLANFCKNFPIKINLIEYNSHAYATYKKSSKENVKLFIDFLERKNLIVTLRLSKGKDIAAACGQLANEKQINDKISKN